MRSLRSCELFKIGFMIDLLKSQFLAAFAMIRSCIELCPDEEWTTGEHPRAFWRVTYHALYYTDLYLSPSLETYEKPSGFQWHHVVTWDDDERGVPPVEHPFSRADILAYLTTLEQKLEHRLAALDLEGPSGIPWYPVSKGELVLITLRHLSVHTGQLQERLYPHGLEPIWAGSA